MRVLFVTGDHHEEMTSEKSSQAHPATDSSSAPTSAHLAGPLVTEMLGGVWSIQTSWSPRVATLPALSMA